MPVAIALQNLFTNEFETLSAFQEVITTEKKKEITVFSCVLYNL